jgi:hypothetical protein
MNATDLYGQPIRLMMDNDDNKSLLMYSPHMIGKVSA